MEQRKKEKFRYLDVCAYYKDLIRSGGLKSGDKVPSIRACAVNLSVSRTTVENAYNILSAEGYLIPKEKSGYYVSGSLPGQPADYSSSGDEKADDGIVYDLLNSSADKKNFDFRIWNRYIKSALRNPDRLLSYGQAQGEPDLRVAVAEYIAKERSVFCSPDQIVIGAGIQTLLSLLCVCLDENKRVEFFGSVFRRGKVVFESHGKETAYISSFDDIGPGSAVYVSPSHFDMYGNSLPMSDRRKLIASASAASSLIIEDDYDSEYRYTRHSAASLYGIAGGKNVVYIGSFSKLLLPSLRINFMVLSGEALSRYRSVSGLFNQTASKTEQIALCQYIRDGHLLSVIRKQRRLFLQKTEHVISRAARICPDIPLSSCDAAYLVRGSVRTGLGAEDFVSRCKSAGILLRAAAGNGGKVDLMLNISGFDIENTDDMLLRLKEAAGV